jgi:hypothetical protein
MDGIFFDSQEVISFMKKADENILFQIMEAKKLQDHLK